jgi:hypothetical protein
VRRTWRADGQARRAFGLAAWLIGCGVLGDRMIEALPRDRLLVVGYLFAVLATGEVVRRTWRADGQARRAFAMAVPDFVAASILAVLGMATVCLRTGDFAMLTGLLGLLACATLWLRRFRQEVGLIHLALLLAWLATGCGARWAIGDRPPGIVLGRLALASAIDGVLLSGLPWIGRRKRIGDEPLRAFRDLGIVLAVASFSLAIAATVVTLDAYPTAFGALLLLISALLIGATSERSAWRVYGAILVSVAAAYLTLFEIGRGRTGHVSALGVLASLLAIAFWGLERLASRKTRGEWREVFATPLGHASILMAVVAILPDWGAPRALLLASVPFLLLIKSVPASDWLYPALALVAASGTFKALDRWGEASLVPLTVASAFSCWAIGLALWRWKSRVCRGLGLQEDLPYESPLYHSAMAMGLAAIGLRLDAILRLGDSWSSRPWVPAALGVLSLLMLKPYPGRGWVDGFIGLMSLALFAMTLAGSVAMISWVLAALSLALLWRMGEWLAVRFQEQVCRSLGIDFDRVATPLREWSFGLLALATLPLTLRIVVSVLSATLGLENSLPAVTSSGWWAAMVAILLFGANLDLARRTLGGKWAPVGPHVTATFLLWWSAVPLSPLVVKGNLDPASLLPVLTVFQGMISVVLGTRSASRPVALYGLGLSLAAVVLTRGRLETATTATLFLATVSTGYLALRFRNRALAGVGSALWGVAVSYASIQVARRFGWDRWPTIATAEAVGLVLSALGLILVGDWDRRRQIGLAAVVERLALAFLASTALAVGVASLDVIGPFQATVNLGVMFAVSSMCVVLAMSWQSMPLAFAAQAAILLGYAAFRSGFNVPQSTDSAALLILAGIELGVAEIAGRGRQRLFALPALVAGLALPLLSVGLSLRNGLIGDESLLILFAAGTFYAAVCGRMRWKSLGYAAAVLYNAALWVLWSRLGWKVAHDPQFYFVPVGFSTILFAEANRRELGRSQVNAIRGLGLTLIYLALAVPIWQTASLAAWAGVLFVSLLGIFAGIGVRSQAFLWLGLAGFVLDVMYQLGRIGMEHALAKWAIMLALGIGLVMFVALNEKKQLLVTMRKYVEAVRQWD